MEKIKVMIVDDEPGCVETLSVLLRDYHHGIVVVDHAYNLETALEKIEKWKTNLDILFLDIQMPGGDGFTLLQKIPEITFKIIFTTAYDQFALRAFRFSALDYLLKPIDNDELRDAILKYTETGHSTHEKNGINGLRKVLVKKNLFEKLAVPTLNEIVFIPVADIIYLESDNNYTILHLEKKQSMMSSRNIGHYEELLEENNFFRIHNSFVINLKKMRKYIKGKPAYVEMENGITLEIAKRRREEFLQLIGTT